MAVACDGAGSASHGGEGASLSARFISSRALNFMGKSTRLPTVAQIEEWIDDLRDMIAQAARTRNLTSRDFATTLVAMVVTPSSACAIHIGDGAIVARMRGADAWSAISWPEHGEYASTTYFVTDDTEARLRTAVIEEPIAELVLLSDGLERLALDFSEALPHEAFFAPFTRAIDAARPGFQRELSRQLASYLASDLVNQRTDDDKSLIVAVCR